MYKNTNILAIALSISLLSLAACSSPTATTEASEKETTIPTYEVITPVKDQPPYSITLPGELKPYEQVLVYAKVKGFVKKVYVDRGAPVHKGQLLALLDAPEISHQHLFAKENENKAEQEYHYAEQAYQRLVKASQTDGAVAGIELDRALSELNRTKSALQASKAQTSIPDQLNAYLRITAPFDGVITQRNISEGALVGDQTDALFHLAQNKKLRLTVSIPEKHAQSIHDTMAVQFTINGQPGQFYSARLSRASQIIQQEGRALIAEFDVDNRDGKLSGGEYAQVKLALMKPMKTLWIPTSSVVRSQSGTFVWTIEADRKLIRTPVITGEKTGRLQEVFGLPNENAQIVVLGTEEMTEGAQVNFFNK